MADSALPTREEDIADAIADALRDGVKLGIVSGASKVAIGAAMEARPLPMSGLAGVIDYDPAELVLTVRPGTPLAEIQALVAASEQMLAFEPFDHGPIFGQAAGSATIGGVIAAAVSGSQRISALAARDHLLGFRAVSGRGEVFSAGAKMVKNVTGYDLPKLAVGSWGRLFAMTELTLKVLPRPREVSTRVILGLHEQQAVRAMSVAMGSHADVAAAAYFPADLRDGESATILRVQGFGPSVTARCAMLDTLLAEYGEVQDLPTGEAAALWEDLRTLAPLGADRTIWRVSLVPRQACEFVASLPEDDRRFLVDRAGGLVWIASEADPSAIREAAARAGGHAMLVRATADMRARVPTFHPLAAGVAALEERVRRAFDPVGLFETGRF